MELLLATHNAHKTREFARILGDQFTIRDLSNDTAATVEETGKTFEENAILKAVTMSRQLVATSRCDVPTAQRAVATMVVADDSGLEVAALDGAPGIFSARYAGVDASDEENVEKLLGELSGARNRSARFRCVIALARAGKLWQTFDGAAEGVIVDLARGEHGFGYDPVFQPNGFDKTFGELAPEIKDRISHRGKAIAKLREGLERKD